MLLRAEKARRKNKGAPDDWQARMRALFPRHLWYEFSDPHRELGRWANDIDRLTKPRPFVAIWPRNRGKSTWAELVAADLGAREKRRYCLYVSETQDQADKHVATIGRVLESETITSYYPRVGVPRTGKNGNRTWNRRVMSAENGFTVEAIGLDKATRGQKIDWVRPDLIIFDDIDAKHDTEEAVKKKIDTITTSILPAGASHCAVLFVQNLIHKNSIATKLSKPPGEPGAADFLTNRIVSGPYKAVEGLSYSFEVNEDEIRWVITSGTSVWSGFDLEVCEDELNNVGPTAFELESQQAIDTDDPNALLSSAILDATRVNSHPDLTWCAVAVDPAGGAGQCGIIGGGTARVGRKVHGFTVADYSTPLGSSSLTWGVAVLRCYHAIGADCIVVERNFGGDLVTNNIRASVLADESGKIILNGKNVPIIEVSASRGKEVRAAPVATLYQMGLWHNVGYYPEYEKQWTQWIPGTKPSPDRLDAGVWLSTASGMLEGLQNLPPQPVMESRWKDESLVPVAASGSRWKEF